MVLSCYIEYDYPNITYPVPFHELYTNPLSHYEDFAKPVPSLPSFVRTGVVQEDSFAFCDYIILTGCSSNHLLPTLNLLLSVVLVDKDASVVFVDYGLEESDFSRLSNELRFIHSMHNALNSTARVYYRKFAFSQFPAWWSLSNRAIRGGYSWKVAALYDLLVETKRIVVWSDGGNLFDADLNVELQHVYTYGAFSPYSGDSLQKWVHGASRKFIMSNKMARKLLLGKGMCNGALIAFDYNNERATSDVVFPFVQCAYTRRCVSPLRTSRKNHRQDQAVLSVFMHSAKMRDSCYAGCRSSVTMHNDCSGERCRLLREYLVRRINVKYGSSFPSYSICWTRSSCE